MINFIEELSRDFCLRYDLEDYVSVCKCDFTYQIKVNGVNITATPTGASLPATYFWECIENGTTNNSLFTNNGESLTIVNPNLQNIVVNNFPVNQNVKFRCTMIDAKGVVILQEITVFKSGTTTKQNCTKEDIPYLPNNGTITNA